MLHKSIRRYCYITLCPPLLESSLTSQVPLIFSNNTHVTLVISVATLLILQYPGLSASMSCPPTYITPRIKKAWSLSSPINSPSIIPILSIPFLTFTTSSLSLSDPDANNHQPCHLSLTPIPPVFSLVLSLSLPQSLRMKSPSLASHHLSDPHFCYFLLAVP